MLQRIANARGAINRSDWKRDFEKHNRRKKFMSKMQKANIRQRIQLPRNSNLNRIGSISLPSIHKAQARKSRIIDSAQKLEDPIFFDYSNDSEFLESIWHTKQLQKSDTDPRISNRMNSRERKLTGRSGRYATSKDSKIPAKIIDRANVELFAQPQTASKDTMGSGDNEFYSRPAYENMSLAELRLHINQMAAELSPSISRLSFKAIVAEMPRRVLMKTLIDVWTAKHRVAMRDESGVPQKHIENYFRNSHKSKSSFAPHRNSGHTRKQFSMKKRKKKKRKKKKSGN
jgi:hypothetical protein